MQTTLELVEGLADGLGCAPTPAVVRAMGQLGVPVARAQAALLALAEDGWLELRPESSMGRVSPEELALMPRNILGVRLALARVL